jgi:hypothetical protein
MQNLSQTHAATGRSGGIREQHSSTLTLHSPQTARLLPGPDTRPGQTKSSQPDALACTGSVHCTAGEDAVINNAVSMTVTSPF